MNDERVRIICQQMALDVGQPAANEAAACEAISEALALGADVVVLPELVTSGYVFESRKEVLARAHSPSSPLFASWRSLVSHRDAVVVGGFPEVDAAGRVYNSAAAVDARGILAIYRKCHLWDEEKLWFQPGEARPPVLETRFGRLGMLICYDLEFPESVRSLMIRGAELIVVPTNWPLSKRPEGERPPEMIGASSAARLNGVFIACCDRVGPERGVSWTGGSCIVDTQGWLVAERTQRDRGYLLADIEVARARDKALNKNNDILRDRRPELYGALVEPHSSD